MNKEELRNKLNEIQQHVSRWQPSWIALFDEWTRKLVAEGKELSADFTQLHTRLIGELDMQAQTGKATDASNSLLKFLNQYGMKIPPMSLIYKFLDLLTQRVNAQIALDKLDKDEKELAAIEESLRDAGLTKVADNDETRKILEQINTINDLIHADPSSKDKYEKQLAELKEKLAAATKKDTPMVKVDDIISLPGDGPVAFNHHSPEICKQYGCKHAEDLTDKVEIICPFCGKVLRYVPSGSYMDVYDTGYTLTVEHIMSDSSRHPTSELKVELRGRSLLNKKAAPTPKQEAEDFTMQMLHDPEYANAETGTSQAYHDYLEDSQTFGDEPGGTATPRKKKPYVNDDSPLKKLKKLKNLCLEYWDVLTGKERKEENDKRQVGRGYEAAKMPLPPVSSPAYFMSAPASKEGSLTKVAIDEYEDHHVSVTFEFMIDSIRVGCTWDRSDLPTGLTEEQSLARIIKFLEGRLPLAFSKFKHARVTDVDLPNRTVSIIIPLEKIDGTH